MEEVATSFIENTNLNSSSMRHKANSTTRLSSEVVSVLSKIASMDSTASCLQPERLNTVGAKYVENVVQLIDCRPYKRFPDSSSLKSATKFMRAKCENGIKMKVNLIYRCRDYHKNQDLKVAQSNIASEHCVLLRKRLWKSKNLCST